jgi:CBS domain containing-hemolysin-like protein
MLKLINNGSRRVIGCFASCVKKRLPVFNARNAGFLCAVTVYKNDYENVTGMVRVHDLTCEFLANQDRKVGDIMSATLFVPETKHTVALLKEFRQAKLSMAVVVDEYGGIAGIVTLEDLVDEIIGDVIEDQSLMFKTSGSMVSGG